MRVKNIVECSKCSILQYFNLIKLPFVIKFLSGRLTQGLLQILSMKSTIFQ